MYFFILPLVKLTESCIPLEFWKLPVTQDLRKKIKKKSTSITSHTKPELDSADRAVIVETRTPAAAVKDASKVSFGSKDVRGKVKKWEVELIARINLAGKINYFSYVHRDVIHMRKPSRDDQKKRLQEKG